MIENRIEFNTFEFQIVLVNEYLKIIIKKLIISTLILTLTFLFTIKNSSN